VAADEDALACDFAQYYHVLDWKRLPLRTAAVFALGLPADSRIMRRLSGVDADEKTTLLALLCDSVSHIAWMFSEDGQRRRNHPASLAQLISKQSRQKETETYRTAADFDAAWKSLAGGDE